MFVGTGAGYPSFMGIPGESLNGVLSANELLTRCNLLRARDFPNFDTPLQPGKHVAVIGAGNTAMDALRVSLRLGAEIGSLHLPAFSRKEAPARAEEIHHAEQEGVDFNWLTARSRSSATTRAACARCAACAWSSASPTPRAGAVRSWWRAANSSSSATSVVFAIGTNANPILGQTSGLALDKRGYIATDENLATSIAGVWGGGDIVTGAATVIQAMGAGRRAARAMKAYLGLRDSDAVYAGETTDKLFGIARAEHGCARVRVA